MVVTDDMLETIGGHLDEVVRICGRWVDDGPDPGLAPHLRADALASWAYVQGYANALGMTARELFSALDLEVP